jgi:hypothetical protein
VALVGRALVLPPQEEQRGEKEDPGAVFMPAAAVAAGAAAGAARPQAKREQERAQQARKPKRARPLDKPAPAKRPARCPPTPLPCARATCSPAERLQKGH